MTDAAAPLVSVRGLEKYYFEQDSLVDRLLRNDPVAVKAVDGVSFDVAEGETLGLVGESGCGKSTAGETLLRLREPTGGRVEFRGENVYDLDGEDLHSFRRRAQIVFQDPFSSLDPRMTVGESVREPLDVHDVGTEEERDERVAELLERVGLSAEHTERYPGEFSGGQRQRVGIARALALDPEFLVLDEPTSALDVSVQAQILNLLQDLQQEFGLTYLFISHDLSVIRHICDRVVVMYLGRVAEVGPVDELFEDPKHPYTRALLESVPRASTAEQGRRVEALQGDVPSPRNPPSGCRFRTRCPAIIPPDVDVEQSAFREVMNLRDRLEQEEFSAATYWELADDPGREDAAAFKREVREEFFSHELDGENRAVVEEALDLLAADEPERAAETLRGRFRTVCETTDPALAAPDHPAACHWHGLPADADVDPALLPPELREGSPDEGGAPASVDD